MVEENTQIEPVVIDPQDYFNYLKSKKNECTEEFLNNLYSVTLTQLQKAMVTGQDLIIRRLHYAVSVIEREHLLLKEGITAFVLREDIESFIESVQNKRVKVVDLEFFPREIPDEIVEKIKQLKDKNIFDNYYVVFTDYTGQISEETREGQNKEAIRRDPILFGAFEQKIDGIYDICDRFYYIGDWEDEYCELTLSKMVQKMTEDGKSNPVHSLAIPEATLEEVKNYINKLDETRDERRFRMSNRPDKQSFFAKICTAWKVLTGERD